MPLILKENPDNENEISIQHQITYSHLCTNSFYKFPSSSQRKDVQTRFDPNRSPFVTIPPALGTFCVFSQYVQSRSEQIHVCEWNIDARVLDAGASDSRNKGSKSSSYCNTAAFDTGANRRPTQQHKRLRTS